MNIKILDSWLRDYLTTKATAQDIARELSLRSISIERVEPYNKDFIYDIEVTTNRPDLLSVVGLAREAAAILPQAGIEAKFIKPALTAPDKTSKTTPLTIIVDEKNTNRICAAIMDVRAGESPKEITERLETSDIRSLNNLIDITNYTMRTIGHPVHVFDYDRLPNHTVRLRESREGETVTTLDGKSYKLSDGNLVGDDGQGNIIDLISIMGLENSVVTNQTKRIIIFLDNVNQHKIRKTSMTLGIRTEAAQMNEKGIDPELAMEALLYSIKLYERYADGKIINPIIDIYPHPYKARTVDVTLDKIQKVLGVPISLKQSTGILETLGFEPEIKNQEISSKLPSFRVDDISIPEDLVEEIARVYGYHNLPSILPPITNPEISPFGTDSFYWERRIKGALKYWGFTEIYSYPMVSEEIYEGPTDKAVRLANPLGTDFVYMRRTLVPSLLKVMQENKKSQSMQIYEIANVYENGVAGLPKETLTLAGLVKKPNINFFMVKGILEQLAKDLGISTILFSRSGTSSEIEIKVGKEKVGVIEILDDSLINFELNMDKLIHHASLHKTFIQLEKYPPIIEDISITIDDTFLTGEIIESMLSIDPLVVEVTLLDKYENSRTFHILYQDKSRNLTTEDVSKVRKSLLEMLKKRYHAAIK